MNANLLANKTLNYIWTHPNCQEHKIKSISKFVGWQFYKRITHKYLDLELIPNLKLRCYPDSYSAASALYCGLYDYNEMNFLLRYLRPEDSFLDIGANIGIYTLLAASVLYSGTIHSFEVLLKNYQRLQENIKLNNFEQVKIYNIAVSDKKGNIFLHLAEGDSMPFITNEASDKTITVPTDTLDNLLEVESVNNLTLAKIDIEGAELLAFQGATNLFKKQSPPVWIMEINNTISNFGHHKKEIIEFLNSYEYKLYSYNANTNQVRLINLEQQQGNNVLAIANSALKMVRDRLAGYCLE